MPGNHKVSVTSHVIQSPCNKVYHGFGGLVFGSASFQGF